jgi:antitoxin FitA
MAVNLSIKNVPSEIVEQLRERAKRHHRSLQGELMAILEESVVPRKLTVRQVYQQVKDLGLTTEADSVDIVRADRDGR